MKTIIFILCASLVLVVWNRPAWVNTTADYYSSSKCNIAIPNRLVMDEHGEIRLYGVDGKTWMRVTKQSMWVHPDCFESI